MTMMECEKMKVNLPYIMRDFDRHGNERVYLRMNGKKTRLRAKPDTPEFFLEYNQAIGNISKSRGAKSIKFGSFRYLCVRYFASPEFNRLAKRTRIRRRQILDSICEAHGDKRFTQMRGKDVRMLRDAKAHVPESANAIIKALRPMFDWAIEAEIARENPARGVKYLRNKSDGFIPWTQEEMERFEERWPTGSKPRLAYSIMRWLGVRRSDAVPLGRQHCKSGLATFRIKKTGRTISIPILPELQKELDAAPVNMTFLVTQYGKPFSDAGFGMRFKEWCDAAGVSKRAHGLRKSRAIELAEGGATVNELMAYFGWETASEAIRYTKAAQQKILAIGAVRGNRREQKVPHRSGGVSHLGKKHI